MPAGFQTVMPFLRTRRPRLAAGILELYPTPTRSSWGFARRAMKCQDATKHGDQCKRYALWIVQRVPRCRQHAAMVGFVIPTTARPIAEPEPINASLFEAMPVRRKGRR